MIVDFSGNDEFLRKWKINIEELLWPRVGHHCKPYILIFFRGKDNGNVMHFIIRNDLINNIDTDCRSNSKFVKIALQHPAEVMSSNYFTVPLNSSVTIYVKPKITKTSEKLRSYDTMT
jgi:hypothetical protein